MLAFVIVWGSGLYGKTDRVGDMFYVATKFGYLWWIPLLPLETWCVIEETGDGWRGAQISMSGKSILVAWLRAGLVLGTLLMLMGAFFSFIEKSPIVSVLFVAAAGVLIAATVFSYRWSALTEASYERAVELANHLGLNKQGMLMIDIQYGRLTAEQAEAALAAEEAAQPPVVAEAINVNAPS
jgi:hypothetical protein